MARRALAVTDFGRCQGPVFCGVHSFVLSMPPKPHRDLWATLAPGWQPPWFVRRDGRNDLLSVFGPAGAEAPYSVCVRDACGGPGEEANPTESRSGPARPGRNLRSPPQPVCRVATRSG